MLAFGAPDRWAMQARRSTLTRRSPRKLASRIWGGWAASPTSTPSCGYNQHPPTVTHVFACRSLPPRYSLRHPCSALAAGIWCQYKFRSLDETNARPAALACRRLWLCKRVVCSLEMPVLASPVFVVLWQALHCDPSNFMCTGTKKEKKEAFKMIEAIQVRFEDGCGTES